MSYSITSYLVLQGLGPLVWGPMSDTWGRRPVYLMSFTTYIGANILLGFTPNYATLLAGRAIQSLGSAATVSIGMDLDLCEVCNCGRFIN